MEISLAILVVWSGGALTPAEQQESEAVPKASNGPQRKTT